MNFGGPPAAADTPAPETVQTPTVAELKADFKQSLQIRMENNRRHTAHQARINVLDEKLFETNARIQDAQDRLTQLQEYNDDLQASVDGQDSDIAALDGNIAKATALQREFLPLMQRMVFALREFVSLDQPFQKERRLDRLDVLDALLVQANVSVSEKFRRVLGAYMGEIDLGRTVETYEDTITIDGSDRTVRLLRFGRIGLYYITFNSHEAGYWDSQASTWRALPKAMISPLEEAIQIAQRRVVPGLMYVAMPPADRE